MRSGSLLDGAVLMLAARSGADRPPPPELRSSNVTSPCAAPTFVAARPGICRRKLADRSGVTRKALALIVLEGAFLCGAFLNPVLLSSFLLIAEAICRSPVLLSMRCTRKELRPAALILTALPGAIRLTRLSLCKTVTLLRLLSSEGTVLRPGACR